MNGLPAIANNLAAKGRYGDSMLMHVSPGEVKGLQALAMAQGGSLTINPDTGLPEAFKLKDILPVIAGAALNFFLPGVGTAIGSALGGLSGAAGTGIAVGGIEALRTGDIGKGLMAGLGAFGGAGLGAASGAGASGTAGGAAGGAGSLGGGLSTTAASTPISTIPAQGLATPLSDVAKSAALSGGNTGLSATTTGASGITASALPSTTTTPGFLDRYISAMGGTKGALAGGFGVAAPFLQQEPVPFPTPEDPYANYEGPYTPSERRVSYPGQRDSTSEFEFFSPSNPVPFAGGGSVPMLEDGGFVLTKKAVDGIGGGSNKKGQQVASKGLGALPIRGEGAKRGPMAGKDDKIKTSIDGRVPARVSNGEAYVPRRAVKKAGGAGKLYDLMRKAERRA